jgi:hypothetical protein
MAVTLLARDALKPVAVQAFHQATFRSLGIVLVLVLDSLVFRT